LDYPRKGVAFSCILPPELSSSACFLHWNNGKDQPQGLCRKQVNSQLQPVAIRLL